MSRSTTLATIDTPAELSRWLALRNEACDMRAEKIRLQDSADWRFDRGSIRRRDGFFFSVVGAQAWTGGMRCPRLDQPLIHQPEIGILGFITSGAGHGREVLVQAKPEPGNSPLCQLAPTVQATLSNYSRRHNGKATPHLEFFTGNGKGRVLRDSLQSEQGTRFLGKYNRNMTVEVEGSGKPVESEFTRWVPVRSLVRLLKEDFTINTDARSVLACTPWSTLTDGGKPFSSPAESGDLALLLRESYRAGEAQSDRSLCELAQLLERSRGERRLAAALQDLSSLERWVIRSSGIYPRAGGFSVEFYSIETSEREVARWDQPFIGSGRAGFAALACQLRKGVLHFLFRCREELGFRGGSQYCPAVQEPGEAHEPACDAGSGELRLRQCLESGRTLLSCAHTDEGGRFYRCVSNYAIVELDEGDDPELDGGFAWMTLGQIEALVTRSGCFSNEARTLVSMLLAYV